MQPTDNSRIKMLLTGLAALLAAGSALLVLLIFVGYGRLQLNVPRSAAVTINGQAVKETELKLRPGEYNLIVSSPLISPYQATVKVGLFRTVRFGPQLRQRDASAIASALIGAVGSAGPPDLLVPRWFANNAWLVGVVVPGNADLAARYDSAAGKWVVGYYNGGGYPTDLSSLPADVSAYIKYLETNYAGG
ncbi:MAG TPA: hypothetical protein VLE74_02655 [Candidatus Saccharimonadales bacterium]|nr:hypothetical protein [Candidatus Saccharimonadales bacterium]